MALEVRLFSLWNQTNIKLSTSYTLVTGGLGYIASHTIPLLDCPVIIIDNVSNSSLSQLEGIKSLTSHPVVFEKLDLTDKSALNHFFSRFHDGKSQINQVLHFAGLKSVSDSLKTPDLYYNHNVVATQNLLDVIEQYPIIKTLIFASSAAVYGSAPPGVKEDIDCVPTTPYGVTKLKVEHILEQYSLSKGIDIAMLRYFNPIGVHPSGKLGEQSNNLMPIVLKSLREGKTMTVFDGVRDYIAVMDVARACILTMGYLKERREKDPDAQGICRAWNLGSGIGMTVKEIIKVFEQANGLKVDIVEGGKREGDVDTLICDPSRARNELGWTQKTTLDQAFKDLWNWYNNQLN